MKYLCKALYKSNQHTVKVYYISITMIVLPLCNFYSEVTSYLF